MNDDLFNFIHSIQLISLSEKSLKTIKSITNSTYLDVIGLIIVLSASISLGYHKTLYNFSFNGENYDFFLGYVSIVNTGFSMVGNRLVTKKTTSEISSQHAIHF
jgi:general stress protein CsbA